MSTEINIFELASRQSTRIETQRGQITTEQLWHMPLTAPNNFSLDAVGQDVIAGLESLKTRSLVNTKPNPRVAELELQLALIKHVIEVKQAEAAAATEKAERATKRKKLIDQLGKKQDAALEQLSEDEIKKQLAALDD